MAVRSPALEVAVVKNGAGVVTSSSHRNGRSARTEVNRGGWGHAGVSVGSAIAQLSFVVISPALEVAVVKDGAGVVPS